MNDAPPPPPTTADGKPRTPSTPGRKPGQRNGTGKAPAAPRPGPTRPPAPRKGKKDYRESIRKTITKIGGAVLAVARRQNQPVIAADAVALLEVKDPLADALNAMAQDADWLGKVLDKVAVIAPGAELASVLLGLVTQIATNHGAVPLEMGTMMGAKDPRELLNTVGIRVVDVVPESQAA